METFQKHFIWSQLLCFGVYIILVLWLLNMSSTAWDLVVLVPVLGLYMVFLYYAFWKPEEDRTVQLNVFSCFSFVVGGLFFFLDFFYIFYPSSHLELEKVLDCTVSGIMNTMLEGNEGYSLLYVNFKKGGTQYLGQSCLSNNARNSTMEPNIHPYSFFNKNDTYPCGPYKYEDNKLNPLATNQQQEDINQERIRILRAGGSHSSGGHSSSSHGSSSSTGGSYGYGYHSRSSTPSCESTYAFSEVKMPSWMCQSHKYNLKQLMQPRTCYINFYNNENQKAEENAKKRLSPKESKEFALVTFDSDIFYDKSCMKWSAVLFFFPFVLSFNCIFQYTANGIVKRLYGEDNQELTDRLYEQQRKSSSSSSSSSSNNSHGSRRHRHKKHSNDFHQVLIPMNAITH